MAPGRSTPKPRLPPTLHGAGGLMTSQIIRCTVRWHLRGLRIWDESISRTFFFLFFSFFFFFCTRTGWVWKQWIVCGRGASPLRDSVRHRCAEWGDGPRWAWPRRGSRSSTHWAPPAHGALPGLCHLASPKQTKASKSRNTEPSPGPEARALAMQLTVHLTRSPGPQEETQRTH